MATSTIIARFRINDKKAAEKVCSVLVCDNVNLNHSKIRNASSNDISKLIKKYSVVNKTT